MNRQNERAGIVLACLLLLPVMPSSVFGLTVTVQEPIDASGNGSNWLLERNATNHLIPGVPITNDLNLIGSQSSGEPWIGVRKLAVVPTFNTQFDPPPPADWSNQVARRIFYDPDPVTGSDRSLRAYIAALSYGRAILEAEIFPFAFSDGPSVFEAAADSLPEGHGYQYFLCVIPLFDGDANRKGYFEVLTRNGVTFRAARVAMNDGPFREPMGVWAMAEWPDLYTYKFRQPLPPGTSEMGDFDNMTYNSGTHSCAELKLRAGWLKPEDVPTQNDVDGAIRTYDLHAIGLSGPSVIGLGGWQNFRFLFSGGNGIIYAVVP